MTHVVEPAASGRSKCRGCSQPIEKGTYRFGEVIPNPFADGETTVWFHLDCALLRRPEAVSETNVPTEALKLMHFAENYEHLLTLGRSFHRLQRTSGLEKAPSGRAKCRHCHEPIAKESWRIQISFFEEGTFNSGGNIHLSCAASYFETEEYEVFLQHFAPKELSAADWIDIQKVMQSP